jgi:hypothetical protein
MVGWIALALWMSGDSSAVRPKAFNHVRSAEAPIRSLIAEGYTRSATFRTLVDATEARSCVVYFASVSKLSESRQGALLHRSAGRGDTPILRVLLRTSLSRTETIAVIAHELQHVVETLSVASLQGGVSFTTGETEAAIAVTIRVREELRKPVFPN